MLKHILSINGQVKIQINLNMKTKILFFISIAIFFGCANTNKNNKFNKYITIAKKKHTIFNVIDSIRGEKKEWFYILGREKSDSIYSSIRIIS